MKKAKRNMKSKKKEPEVWLDTAQVMFGWNSKVASEYYKKNPDAKLPPLRKAKNHWELKK